MPDHNHTDAHNVDAINVNTMNIDGRAPKWLQPTLREHALVVITSSLTETKPIEVLAEQHDLTMHAAAMPMGSTENRERFSEVAEIFQRKQLPLIFLHGQFVGGLYELSQLLTTSASGITTSNHSKTIKAIQWLTWGLGLAGLLPFIYGMLGLLMGTDLMFAQASDLITYYGLFIAVFMAGTLWGGTFGKTHGVDLVVSNLITLTLAGLLFIEAGSGQILIALAASFIVLWVIDLIRWYGQRIPTWYFYLRCILSSSAVLACLAAYHLAS